MIDSVLYNENEESLKLQLVHYGERLQLLHEKDPSPGLGRKSRISPKGEDSSIKVRVQHVDLDQLLSPEDMRLAHHKRIKQNL